MTSKLRFAEKPFLFFLTFCFCILIHGGAWGSERVPIPTPPGGGEGVTLGLQDMAIPVSGAIPSNFETKDRALARLPQNLKFPPADKALPDIGGDDVLVADHGDIVSDCSMDIAANGDCYLAVEFKDPVSGFGIWVFRSTDGGDSWDLWGTLSDPSPDIEYARPSLLVAEGSADRCFVAYTKYVIGPELVCIAGCDLAATVGDFSAEIVVMENPDYSFSQPSLASDAASFSSYYLYLAAWGRETDGGDIWFARSTNQGTSFESSYIIASIVGTDRDYMAPSVAYGYGNYVHVAWKFSSRDGGFDSATRYRRASNFANGGLTAWDPIKYPTGSSDAEWEEDHVVAASLTSNQVLIGFSRRENEIYVDSAGIIYSTDAGATLSGVQVIPGGFWFVEGLEQQPATGDWIMAGSNTQMSIQRASSADLTSWSPAEVMEDTYFWSALSHRNAMALDPSHDDRVALAWSAYDISDHNPVKFDAEWRADPGYPNLENGYPLGLDHQPISPPALVDLGGDPNLETVFSDDDGNIQAIQANGSNLPGWPVHVGTTLADGPVAVGSLDGHRLYVIAGSTDGRVFAYYADGTPAEDAWPYDLGTGLPVYVSIGAVGGPYPRSVVACSGTALRWVNYRGVRISCSFDADTDPSGPAGPAAIGDIDGDGVSEAVACYGSYLYAFDMRSGTPLLAQDVGPTISGAPTLGDFDNDGDVEIVVPTVDGRLYLFQGDGSLFPGAWPFTSSTNYKLSSAAIGQCLGTWEPEIAVSAYNFKVHMVYSTGIEHSNYPVENDGWFIPGAPIMGRVDGSSSDVVVGARGTKAWAWSNIGTLIPGWPKVVADNIYQTPAMGDIDRDGSNEIVLLSTNQMIVVDVNNTPNDPSRTWAMYGHDPQRTGCSDCPEDIVSRVPGDTEGITRVSFALPSPNPSSGAAVFNFAVPVRAQVRLDIYDLRGALVRTVLKEEMAAGSRVIGWDGLDQRGRRPGSGHYFARLQVRGPGVRDTQTRKITLLK